MLVGFAALPAAAGDCPAAGERLAFPVSDPAPFEAALAATADLAPWPSAVSGVVLPHHLEAAHLMAGGLRLAVAGQGHDRVILLFPDHFNALRRPFATVAVGFDTPLGPVPAASGPAEALLAAYPDLIEARCAIARDHGLWSLLPFVAALLPGVEVLPVAISLRAGPADLAAMEAALVPHVGPGTLILQSTDFSHYLPQHVARLHDQQVLNLLAAGDLGGLARLVQPDHLDSVAAMLMQMRMQARHFGAAPVVVASANMQDWAEDFIAETTSYIVALWNDPAAPAGPPLQPGAAVTLIGGDTYFGRAWPRLLVDELVARRVEEAIRPLIGDRPLVVNLEGVLMEEVPSTLGPLTLGMPEELAVAWLTRLGVIGVGLANNHALDLGPEGLAETRAALVGAGIAVAAQGERLMLPGGVALVVLTDLGGAGAPALRLDDAALEALVEPDATVPVIAFVHWGREGDPAPGARELALAEAMRARGVAAILGAHPHVASPGAAALAGGDTLLLHSLGNFMFDQTGPGVSGALAELWAFPQGTVFLRRLPLPDLFGIARGR